MSTRYVWDIYNTSLEYSESYTTKQAVQISYQDLPQYTYIGASAKNCSFDKKTGIYTISDLHWMTINQLNDNGWGNPTAKENPYFILQKSNTSPNTAQSTIIFENKFQNQYAQDMCWSRYADKSTTVVTHPSYLCIGPKSASEPTDVVGSNGPPPTSVYRNFAQLYNESVTVKGDSNIGLVSSATSFSYPNNGAGTVSGTTNNWYVYKGSDSIDPVSVTCFPENPERGQVVTVTVNPRANYLGGTVSYLYQYSINGGLNWSNAGSVTTDIQKEITVPENAEQFMVRVRAQDNLGFTSADYVTGNNSSVQTMMLLAGIENVAKQGKKLWIGVNGTAHKVTRGWVGDSNGVAKRFF